MYLFIFESIGTSELLLIGIVALIFLGPRKLPQIAKTLGKTLNEFRNATNEFKSTWEREVNFEEEEKAIRTGDYPGPPVARRSLQNENLYSELRAEIRQLDKTAFDELSSIPPTAEIDAEPAIDPGPAANRLPGVRRSQTNEAGFEHFARA